MPQRSLLFGGAGVFGFFPPAGDFLPIGPIAYGKVGRRRQQHEAVEKSRPRKSFFRGLL